jgi:hypothetical protein
LRGDLDISVVKMKKNTKEILIALTIGLSITFFGYNKYFVDSDFDSKIPDTKSNKKRFKEFFGFDPTNDVKDIYCFFDPLGFDPLYQLAFSCDKNTVLRIADELNLSKPQSESFQTSIQQEFPWWHKADIDNLEPLMKINDDRDYYYFLWYDTISKKAYYLEYDM